MKLVFKLMAFSIMLNFAVGLMLVAIVDADGNPVFNEGNTFGMEYDGAYIEDFESGMNSTVTPEGGLEDSGDAIYRVLDMMNVGFIGRFIKTVDKYMFGFVKMMQSMIGGYLAPALNLMIFGALRTLIGFGYVMGAWYLWTGKDVSQ